MWLRGVMAEIQRRLRDAIPFFLDIQNAQDLALNPVFHKRSKHIAIKIREHVNPGGENRRTELIHVRTDDQTEDIFTKELTGPAFEERRSRSLGVEKKSSAAVAN